MAESATLRQSSFSGGLLSPQLLGRVDLQKYQSGFAVLRNFLVVRNGAIENRSGSVYVANVKNSANQVRLVKFGISTNQELLLEMGNLYLRFYLNGAPIGPIPMNGLFPAAAWSSLTTYQVGTVVSSGSNYFQAKAVNTNVTPSPTFNATWALLLQNPWNSGQAYTPGMMVLYAGVYYLCIANTTNNAPPNATYWYAQPSATVYELPTSIPQAALATLTVAQIQDQLFIANQLFQPQQLTYSLLQLWTMAAFTPTTGIAAPTGVNVTNSLVAGNAPSAVTAVGGDVTLQPPDQYVVSAYLPIASYLPLSPIAISTVGQADAANNVVISWTNNQPEATGFYVYKLNHTTGQFGLMANVAGGITTTFTDTGIPPSTQPPPGPGYVTYDYVITAVSLASGAEGFQSNAGVITTLPPNGSYPNAISWNPVTGAASYNIYSIVNGIPGFIGSSVITSFNDTGITPNTAKQPPAQIPLFSTPNDYPAVVAAMQSRLLFANTFNAPQTAWGSNITDYHNFTNFLPVTDAMAFSFTLTGNERQFINGIIDIGKMVILTSGGEYVAPGNAFGEVTATATACQRNGTSGAALVSGFAIGITAIYVDSAANIIRDLRYSIYTTTYAGKDTTLYAPQLFENNTILQIDWQKTWNSIVWCVQTKGALLGMTYIMDQEMWAWSAHDFYLGIVEQVCCVREGPAVTVYLVVNRTVLGATQRTIERLANREFADLQYLTDAIFTDCSMTYDGRNTSATTVTSSTAGTWTPNDVITLTSSVAAFGTLSVGNAVVLREIANGTQLMPIDPTTANANTIPAPYPIGWVIDQVVFTIIGITSTSIVTCTPSKNVPTWAQGIALTTWGLMANTFSGMTQLAGLAISAQGDGAVVANALTDATPTVVSNAGVFTTTRNYLVLTAGLPIIGQVQTLPRDSGGRTETLMNKEQLMVEAAVMFYNTRGGYWGPDFQHLYEWDQRGIQFEPIGQAPALFTGRALIPLAGAWQDSGQVCLQQTDPLPMSISAIAPTGYTAEG